MNIFFFILGKMSCGMSRKRHNESAYCEVDLKTKVNCLLDNGTSHNMAAKTIYTTTSKNKTHHTTSTTPQRTPLTRQLAIATRRTLAGITPLSRRKAEKAALPHTPVTPNVYLSPVGAHYQNVDGKENLYTSIASRSVKVDSNAMPMTRVGSCNKMSFRGKKIFYD